MKRFLLPLLSLLAIGSLTSCFQSEITLRLNKDGSGTLTEENSFGQQAVEMLAQFSQLGGAGAKDTAAVCAMDAGDAYAWRTFERSTYVFQLLQAWLLP